MLLPGRTELSDTSHSQALGRRLCAVLCIAGTAATVGGAASARADGPGGDASPTAEVSGPTPAAATEDAIRHRALVVRLRQLAGRVAGVPSAAGAVRHADEALRRAGRFAAGEAEARRRALAIAEAALELASRRVELADERAAHARAERRRGEARAREEAARGALERTRAQLAALEGPRAP